MVMFVWEFVLDLVAVMRMADDEKDIEIMLLRQQLRIATHQQQRGPQIPRWQKVPLAVLAMRLKQKTRNAREVLAESVRLFKPETMIGWHRALVRRKWTFKTERKPGRPPIDRELEDWILRVAHDNPGLGYDKLEGEFRKMGVDVSATTIRTVLQRHGILPAPERVRQGSFVAYFPQPLQRTIPGVRFLHGGNPPAANLVRFVFHRTQYTPGVYRRLHGTSQYRLGHPTGTPDDLGVGST